MPRLVPRKRARLPDRAFAYVDSRGRRRLPMHDKVHVRNALARFNQVVFENDAARDRARRRLLNAAKKYRIVPVGFIIGQLQSERRDATARSAVAKKRRRGPALPTGFLTLLMTDIEASTGLLQELGDRYGDVLNDVRGIIRTALRRGGGREIDARADEYFAVFEGAPAAIEAAVAAQRELGNRVWTGGFQVRVRIGIHSGRPTLRKVGYIGLAVHTTARVCSAAHGGQIVVSAATRAAVGTSAPAGIRFRNLGRHRLPGLPDLETLFQVHAAGLRASFPRPRSGRRPAPRNPPGGRDGAGLVAQIPGGESQLELPQPPA
jgi:class 3 adenylate cyclase